MNTLEILPRARLYLKKIKDQKLKDLFLQWIEKIHKNAFDVGMFKAGYFKDIYACEFRHNKTDYLIAYTIELKSNSTLAVVILAGERENFYDDLKRYIKEISMVVV